ncbi:MAG: barstar family protein [Rivularia sp. (in: cyanobacteria)]
MFSIDNIFGEQASFLVKQSSPLVLEEILSQSQEENPKYNLMVIDGVNCTTKENFFEEASSRLDFPEYFGRNWDAFNDSFTETLWSQEKPQCIFIILNAEKLLSNAQEIDLSNMLEILKDAITEVSTADDMNLLVKIIFVLEDIQASRVVEIMKKQSFSYKEVF